MLLQYLDMLILQIIHFFGSLNLTGYPVYYLATLRLRATASGSSYMRQI